MPIPSIHNQRCAAPGDPSRLRRLSSGGRAGVRREVDLRGAEFEGKGVATALATDLVARARRAAPDAIVVAQTVAQSNASTHILTKLGFRQVGTDQDDEVVKVWEWHLIESLTDL